MRVVVASMHRYSAAIGMCNSQVFDRGIQRIFDAPGSERAFPAARREAALQIPPSKTGLGTPGKTDEKFCYAFSTFVIHNTDYPFFR